MGEIILSLKNIKKQFGETEVLKGISLDVEQAGDLITLRISGNGFLYNMVRIIAGTLVEAGRGFRSPESVKELARTAGVSPNAMTKRLLRLRESLRVYLEREGVAV